MYDALLQYVQLANQKSKIMEQLELNSKAYALATIHRAENTDNTQHLKSILKGLAMLAREGVAVIVPLHPRTRNAVSDLSDELLSDKLRITNPVSYLNMLLLEKNARVILTDSGGVQKEAFFFRVPCVSLREETEWVETVESGWNTLVGWDPERICRAALEAQPGAESAWPYGDGRAAERIVSALFYG